MKESDSTVLLLTGWGPVRRQTLRVFHALLLISLAGCATRTARVLAADSVIRHGECLRVVFVRDGVERPLSCIVDASGNISLPFGVKVPAAGALPGQIAQAIQERYVPDESGGMQILVSRCE